jgi:D-xylose reductase
VKHSKRSSQQVSREKRSVDPKKPLHKLWPDMEALQDKNLTKAIGLCNFNTQPIWDLLCYCRIQPAAVQVEINPQNAQSELVRFLLAKGILPIGYTPVAKPGAVENGDSEAPPNWPDLRNNEYLQSVAAKYNKTVVQVMLNWGISRNVAVIPKATSLKYQLENLDIYDFSLTEEETAGITALDGGVRLCNKFGITEKFDVFA